MKKGVNGFLSAFLLLVTMVSGCIPSEMEAEATEIATSIVSITAIPSPTITVTPATPSAPPSPPATSTLTLSLTPNIVEEGPLLTFTIWENNTSFVYACSVGCLDQAVLCVGEMKLLFEIQNINLSDTHWSPDGNKLAFEGEYESDAEKIQDIFIIDYDGQNLINISNVVNNTTNNEFRTFASSPHWSPDGTTIAYNLCHLGCKVNSINLELGVINQLLEKIQSTDIRLGGWSPSGEQMVFTMDDISGNSQVFISELDGANLIQITDTLEDNYSASFSPNGDWVLVNRAFSAEGLPFFSSLYIISMDGTGERRLTDDEKFYLATSSWHPDSRWIPVIGETGPQTGQIYLINIDGKVFPLNLEPGKYFNPSFAPSQKP